MRALRLGVAAGAVGLLLGAGTLGGGAGAAPASGRPGPVAGAPIVPLTLGQLPKPLPKPYDESQTPAQVKARLDAAFAKATREDKRVIVDLGGNWCSWCRLLASVMDLPTVKPFVEANFVVVPVNVSTKKYVTDHNQAVLKRFGIAEVEGYPWLVVAEANGKVMNSSPDVTDEDHETPQGMVNWLAKWAKHPAR